MAVLVGVEKGVDPGGPRVRIGGRGQLRACAITKKYFQGHMVPDGHHQWGSYDDSRILEFLGRGRTSDCTGRR